MFFLQMLGGLSLADAGGRPPGRASQRLRLAVLAVLARAPRRTATRDRLIGLLWPECPAQEARHRLSSALYDLRQALGPDAILSRGDDVSLTAPLDIDVERFLAAVAQQRWDEAVAAYSGPFLDGVYLEDGEAFERWIEEERIRLERDWLRARGAFEAGGGAPVAGRRGPDPVEPAATITPRPGRRLLAAALLAVTALAIGWGRTWRSGRPGPAGAIRVAVFPFRAPAAVQLRDLGPGIVDLLSLGLDGTGDLRTIDPGAVLAGADSTTWRDPHESRVRARRLGADSYISGSIEEAAGLVRVHATMYNARSGAAEAEAFAEDSPDRLIALVDRLSAGLLAGRLRDPGEQFARMGTITSTSLPAIKAWLAGEGAFRQGRYATAAASFEMATTLDSTFALAHYRHSLATIWGDRPGASTTVHDSLAQRYAGRMGPREHRLLEAYAAWRMGDPRRAERLYQEILTAWPDNVEGWVQLGETRFHYNPLRGRPVALARAAFERALELDPGHRGAEWHLALLSALEGRRDAFLGGLERLASRRPEPNQGSGELAVLRAAIGPGDPGALLAASDANTLFALAWRMAVFVGDLDGAERALRPLVGPGRNEFERLVGQESLALLAAARGRLREAVALLADAPRAGPDLDPGLLKADLLARWGPGFSAAERLGVRDALRRTALDASASTEAYRTYLSALLALEAGRVEPARADASRLDRLDPGRQTRVVLQRNLRGFEAELAGRHEEALAALADAEPVGWFGLAVSGDVRADPRVRMVRAEALFALGRLEEAAGWYQSLGEHALRDLVYLAPAHFRQGQILERVGRRPEARRHFAAVVRLWAGADPELQPLVGEARARLEGRWAETTSRR